MLLRFIALHGIPRSESDWALFRAWKAAQLAAEPCEMMNVEAKGNCCIGCRSTDCPKNHR